MSDPCIFCKIASGVIPADLIYQDEHFVAFHDITPQAPVHVLVIPRQHIASLSEADDASLLAGLLEAVRKISSQLALVPAGWRTVINTGTDGGQTVMHLHAHILAGRFMQWPPF